MRLIEAEELVEHAEVNCESKEFVRKLIDYVADTPTIEPERKKGKWIDLKCDQCGQVDTSKPNFCPYCGADMRGEEE